MTEIVAQQQDGSKSIAEAQELRRKFEERYAKELAEKPSSEVAQAGCPVHYESGIRIGKYGFTPLIEAILSYELDKATEIINRCEDINVHNHLINWLPIHYAAENGQVNIIELLIKKGADVNAKGIYGGTPLRSANTPETAKVLIDNGADPFIKNQFGETAKDCFCKKAEFKTFYLCNEDSTLVQHECVVQIDII